MPLRRLHDFLVSLSHVERRLEPFFREAVDSVLREPQAAIIQFLINVQRKDEGLKLAEERPIPDEELHLQQIIDRMHDQMAGRFKPGGFERGGNTKTHGVVRAEFTVLEGLPENLRKGVFAQPRTFKAWVRFAGPGPDVPKDIEDVGFASMAIKLMGVEGPKLMDEEKATQDLICVMTPTFVTPDTKANASLQKWSLEHTPLWYFLNPGDTPHPGFSDAGAVERHPVQSARPDLLQQRALSPGGRAGDEVRLPAAHQGQQKDPRRSVRQGPGQLPSRQTWPGPWRSRTPSSDICVQIQTDPHRMPIENAGVRWPLKLSPHVTGREAADSQADLRFTEADGLRQGAEVEPLARAPRAPPPGQPEPRAPADVLGNSASTART